MELNEEKVNEIAGRYGLTVKKVKNKEEAGFYIGGKKLEREDIFSELNELIVEKP